MEIYEPIVTVFLFNVFAIFYMICVAQTDLPLIKYDGRYIASVSLAQVNKVYIARC